ncbi:hypothetical protein QTP70_004340 [Hemibagrus guttatus]|uniref:ribonuclease H n=1 Tax=Hemibagrus guttatus TaxID=175788 RepID=A0AAE0QJD2_9TELE|nr:hypothetical protein QTP70_004340 [Hemibagrus guttatus]
MTTVPLHSHPHEMLQEARHEANQEPAATITRPHAVCVSPKSLHRRCYQHNSPSVPHTPGLQFSIQHNHLSAPDREAESAGHQHLPLQLDPGLPDWETSVSPDPVLHLAKDLTWSLNTSSITKKAQQHLYFLRRLRKAHLPPPILPTFYRGTIESILSRCITASFGNCSHTLVTLLLSEKRYCSIRAHTSRLLNSFFPQAISLCSSPIASSANGSNTSASGGAPLQNTSPIMDPAELRDIIVRQGASIRSYQEQMESLQDQLRSASLAAPWDTPTDRGESPCLALPDKFEGSADRCRGFLRQCEVFFSHQPEMYSKGETQCALVMSLLTDRALEWASAVWDADPQIRSSFVYFSGMIREVFEYPAGGKDISIQLMELRQGSDAAADYAIRFRTLAAQSGWNDASLWAVFRAGLKPELQAELACRTEDTTLSQFVATAIRLDNLLRQHQAGPSRFSSSFREEVPEPMQLGRFGLAEPAQQQWSRMRLCYNCGASGHLSPRCPERPSSAQVGGGSRFFSLLVPVSLCVSNRCVSVSALIDSGAAVNLIDGALVERLGIPTFPCLPPLRITAIDSRPIAGHIRPSTSPAAAGFFFVGKKDGGLRPCIDYRGLNAITVPYPYPLPLVPAVLEQLRGARIFSKLDLRSAYNLVRIKKGDEWKTAFHTTHGHYEYRVMPFGLTNAPAVFQALINGVFQDLLGKWVIAYIDDILVYSASLEEHVLHVREVLSRLQQHHLYVKLEKCEFHRSTVTFLGYVVSRRGVEMDEVKVRAVTDWSAPTTVRELQRFLGFANFYRRFIRNYSSVAGPLTSLLRGKPKKLTWTDQARAAFQQLKDCFTSAPILRHPDPDLPFVVEVDASSSGLGAVLSQRHGEPGKLYPCAFYSRKLTTAEANYDVGNRELLAIKAALEEWRHWLEGARHPFQVLTDHRNLEYLRGAKRLNPRQARWALFFTRFRFMVTYRPGSKNGKADALSRRFEGADEPVLSEPILPPTAILAPVRWNLVEEIQRTHAEEPPPAGCPPTKVFVPPQFRTQVIQWVHEAPSSGHPGVRRSTHLVRLSLSDSVFARPLSPVRRMDPNTSASGGAPLHH